MSILWIFLFYLIIQYISIADTNDEEETKKDSIPFCYIDNPHFQVEKKLGETAELTFTRDPKSSIDDSQLLYYKLDCKDQNPIVIIETEKVQFFSEHFNGKGYLKINDDSVIYTISKTQSSDSGIYVFRQNSLHFQIYLKVDDIQEEQIYSSGNSYGANSYIIVVSLLALLVVVVIVIAIWCVKKKHHYTEVRMAKKEISTEQNHYNKSSPQVNISISQDGVAHRNPARPSPEESPLNTDFEDTKKST